MCRINPPKDDTEKTDSDEEVERVMGGLTQEERESVMQELENEEWKLPTPHMREIAKRGVMRSEKEITRNIGERGEDRATIKHSVMMDDTTSRKSKEVTRQRTERPGKKKKSKRKKNARQGTRSTYKY